MKPGDIISWDKENTSTGFIVRVYQGTQNPLVGEELMAEVMWLSGDGKGRVLAHPACFLYLLSEGEE